MLAAACATKQHPPRLEDQDVEFAPTDATTGTTNPRVEPGGSLVAVAPDDVPPVADDAPPLPDDAPTLCLHGGTTLSPWQMQRTMGPVCYGRSFTTHGDPAEYAFARVPAPDDRAWTAVAATAIDFHESSALCGRTCACLDGGEFTYFQTFLDVASLADVRSLVVTMGSVDDGARVTVFNAASPDGVTDPAAYVHLGGHQATDDLARYLVAGRNRVVITHLDDCCASRPLAGVALTLNGAALGPCR